VNTSKDLNEFLTPGFDFLPFFSLQVTHFFLFSLEDDLQKWSQSVFGEASQLKKSEAKVIFQFLTNAKLTKKEVETCGV
jgi:hypothetical protein